MIALDVNVLVYAARPQAPHHETARRWLVAALTGAETVIVTDDVLAATVRILTNRRVLDPPDGPDEAIDFAERVRTAPATARYSPSPHRWEVFARLVTELGLRATSIPDALIAATAIDAGARLATFDRGFRRFPGLDVLVPGGGHRA